MSARRSRNPLRGRCFSAEVLQKSIGKGVIETDDIVADNHVDFWQVFDKPVDVFFEIRRAVLLVAVPDDADGDAHHVGLVPAADFRGGGLRRRAHDSRRRWCAYT